MYIDRIQFYEILFFQETLDYLKNACGYLNLLTVVLKASTNVNSELVIKVNQIVSAINSKAQLCEAKSVDLKSLLASWKNIRCLVDKQTEWRNEGRQTLDELHLSQNLQSLVSCIEKLKHFCSNDAGHRAILSRLKYNIKDLERSVSLDIITLSSLVSDYDMESGNLLEEIRSICCDDGLYHRMTDYVDSILCYEQLCGKRIIVCYFL